MEVSSGKIGLIARRTPNLAASIAACFEILSLNDDEPHNRVMALSQSFGVEHKYPLLPSETISV